MGYIFIGHAGLLANPNFTPPEMEIVGIPEGTTVQFYADAGQGLAYNASHLDGWGGIHAPWPPLNSGQVSYNFTLRGMKQHEYYLLFEHNPQLAYHTPVLPGSGGLPDELRMCTGNPETCPTDPREVAAGKLHSCDGILGVYPGDLHWLGCNGIVGGDRAVTNAALTGVSRSVTLGSDPDWLPGESDQWAMGEVNGNNVKGAHSSQPLRYVLGGYALLIGNGHRYEYLTYAEWQPDLVRNEITVRRGNWHDAGILEFTGVPPQKQEFVEFAVSHFSQKKVRFRR
ncbi:MULTISPECIES: hypothetical protein [unclassified Streptomyces]|uniref:hypothetical protein n=1 Tax=unclassified Streptomyces TaxID=2593676 RepID=UPI00344C2350